MVTVESNLVYGFLKVLVALVIYGLSSERGVQLVKVFLAQVNEWLKNKAPWLMIKDKKSFLVAAVVAFVLAFYGKVDLNQYVNLLNNLDPQLVQAINALLLLAGMTKAHDSLFKK